MKVVCAMGASGYIASWLVKFLLARGYTVHATVRSLDDPKKIEHLLALDGAKERLFLFEANLSEEGSFHSAVNGCVCVFHTSSHIVSVDDPQAQIIDPVEGTLNVLKSAAKVSSIKQVIFTSSSTAIVIAKKSLESGDVVDGTWFSDPVICEQKKLWYPLSKTLAEVAAMKFSEENDLELVTIIPGIVIGPFLQSTPDLSCEAFINLIKTGKDFFPDGIYRLADVRDVANARYLTVGNTIRSSVIMEIVDKLFPAFGHSERYKHGKCNEKLTYSVSRYGQKVSVLCLLRLK